MVMSLDDTIAAIATGVGPVGIIRVSGPGVLGMASHILGSTPQPRHAYYTSVFNLQNQLLDQGILLYFRAPNSFTGQDVLEFQGHGGRHVMSSVLEVLCAMGARLAEPGEFSKRAFMLGKIDLAQAESLCDLIGASSAHAARAAARSLEGELSKRAHQLSEAIAAVRTCLEAHLNFPEDDLGEDFSSGLRQSIESLEEHWESLYQEVCRGVRCLEIPTGILVGEVNVGKSSLMNLLARRDVSIVTNIPGTTRDVLHEDIEIGSFHLRLCDTAGLRETSDPIECLGIKKTQELLKKSDLIFLMTEASSDTALLIKRFLELHEDFSDRLLVIRNKIDLTLEEPSLIFLENIPIISMSVAHQKGLPLLQQALQSLARWGGEPTLSARPRHRQALEQGRHFLYSAKDAISLDLCCVADDLLRAQRSVESLTGAFGTEDLLGQIFSTFCIGK